MPLQKVGCLTKEHLISPARLSTPQRKGINESYTLPLRTFKKENLMFWTLHVWGTNYRKYKPSESKLG